MFKELILDNIIYDEKITCLYRIPADSNCHGM